MKYYLSDIIPKLQSFSRQLDELTLIQNHHWVAFDSSTDTKTTYIFRDNKDLLISQSGNVKKSNWDYLGNQTILIENSEESLLFRNSFFDETILVLNLHNTDTYAFFLNETKIGNSFKTIEKLNEYLNKKYSVDSRTNKVFNSFTNLEYKEGLPENKFDIFFGSYTQILITFSNDQYGYIMQGKSTGKYFYLHSLKGRTYAKSKEDCIYQLYLHQNGQV
ncbi:hypothetical protein [Flavobacterium gilvum]|uniref:Uncharacterized protein n=1 Tax=Flavobacterium gilvum TaxID=1492737 RepID=A0AAC9I4Z8_9FLAO|nr:hypothetical protein [Flavobacterium gilvum]AOW10534.1 hypothetical protein EM308_14050 [Flavobacterium gilvum]KFC58768.1 hypothetical protein FEM08_25010 [Flavobacterium gilvum]